MQTFQDLLYQTPLDIEKVKNAIPPLQSVFTNDEIDHQLIIAASLRYDRAKALFSLLFDKKLTVDRIFHNDLDLLEIMHQPELHLILDEELEQLYADELDERKEDEEQTKKMMKIIQADDFEGLRLISMQGQNFDFNQKLVSTSLLYDYEEIPLLSYAIQCNASSCAKFLMINGASILEPTVGGISWIPFAFSASKGNLKMMQLCQPKPFPSNFVQGAFEAAATFHQNGILKWLFKHTEIIHNSGVCQSQEYDDDDEIASCALIAAVINENIEGIDVCLGNGADPNFRNEDSEPLLFLAIKEGNLEIVKKLHEAGARPWDLNGKGETSIVVAVRTRNVKMVKYLTEIGGNVQDESIFGETPLYIAAENGDLEIAEILLENGANPNDVCTKEYTPMTAAFDDQKNPALFSLLVKEGGILSADRYPFETFTISDSDGKPINLFIFHDRPKDQKAVHEQLTKIFSQ